MGNNNRINFKIKKSMNVINFTNDQLSGRAFQSICYQIFDEVIASNCGIIPGNVINRRL